MQDAIQLTVIVSEVLVQLAQTMDADPGKMDLSEVELDGKCEQYLALVNVRTAGPLTLAFLADCGVAGAAWKA